MSRDEDLTVSVGGGDVAWLASEAKQDTSLDSLQEYRRVPTLRIVQGMTKREVKQQIGEEGNLFLNPGIIPICGPEVWLPIVPVFMYTEFRKYSDIQDPDTPTVLDRTFDHSSELATICRDFDRNRETYGQEGKYEYKYMEVLVWLSTIYSKDHPQYGSVFAVEFQSKNFKNGRNWASSICSRLVGGKPVPLWAQVWQLRTRTEVDGANSFWVYQTRNPEDGKLYIDQEEADAFKGLHQMLKEDFDKRRVIVEGTEDLAEDPWKSPDVQEAEKEM